MRSLSGAGPTNSQREKSTWSVPASRLQPGVMARINMRDIAKWGKVIREARIQAE
jgi:hypothetical protein